jgi:predicted PurR-regulated permease PerM
MISLSTAGPRSFWNPPTWALMAIARAGILLLGLVPPVLAGLAIFSSTLAVRRHMVRRWPGCAPAWATLICTFLWLSVIVAASFGISAVLDAKSGLPAMAKSLTEGLTVLRQELPESVAALVPTSTEALTSMAVVWIQEHASVLTTLGAKVTKVSFQLILGLLVGGLAAHAAMVKPPTVRPGSLAQGMLAHFSRFRTAFEQVVFAQVYIAATNAVFTGVFLVAVMPALGFPVPFVKTLVSMTFLLGFIPILGNVISNALICGVALTISPMAAGICLVFLVVIHKLEYFLNAWIMGNRIRVQSYELLSAMLVLEALFGLWGMALAPVLYAYFKEELRVSESPAVVAVVASS